MPFNVLDTIADHIACNTMHTSIKNTTSKTTGIPIVAIMVYSSRWWIFIISNISCWCRLSSSLAFVFSILFGVIFILCRWWWCMYIGISLSGMWVICNWGLATSGTWWCPRSNAALGSNTLGCCTGRRTGGEMFAECSLADTASLDLVGFTVLGTPDLGPSINKTFA